MLVSVPSIEATEVSGHLAYVLVSFDRRVRATVIPDLGMLVSSLIVDELEFLGRPNTVAAFAADGATTGVPLLHPWANRLGAAQLQGVGRPTVTTRSPLIPTDANGLAIHGIVLAGAVWETTVIRGPRDACVRATMSFDDPERLALFPFPHRLSVTARLVDHRLTLVTEVGGMRHEPVPISFGWHPYFQIPGVPREEWLVRLPVRRRAILDERMLPTGQTEAVTIPAGPLGVTTYDDAYVELEPNPVFAVGAGDRGVEIAFGPGYPVAQVYAPADRAVIAFEPMTAPVNALVSGDGLRWIAPGGTFTASFTIRAATG